MKTLFIRFLSLLILISAVTACAGQATETPSVEDQASEKPDAEVEIHFAATHTNIQPGECTILKWEVSDGYWVRLGDKEVPNMGEEESCPTETREYSLFVDMGTHVETRTVEITVSGMVNQPVERKPPGTLSPVTPGTPAYQAGSWLATGGPPGGLGYDIRMDPRNSDVMYVTDALAGAFKSTDGGQTWFPINNGITARTGPSVDHIPVFSLTIDPNNPDTLWVGTQFGGGVFRSDDGGMNWRSLSNGILERALTIRGFAVEPGNSNVVYLAGEISSWDWNNEVALPGFGLDMTKGAVYKTTDGGQFWKRIWLGDNLARYIWIHPENHDLLYVSTGIFDREAANSNPVTVEPGGVGILRSRDGGNTWQELGVNNGIQFNELYFGSLFMHPENPDILLAAAGNDVYLTQLGSQLGAVYLTENGGDTWQRVLELNNASVVEICESDPDVMYAGSINGFRRSMDGGQNWMEVSGVFWGSDDVLAGFPIDMQCDPHDPMRIFVNNYIGGNFLSNDGGLTWQTASKGYSGAIVRQVDIAWDDPAHVYNASRMGVFVSRDGGSNWQGTASFPARAPEGIVVSVDPYNADHILAVLGDAGPDPKESWDGGQTWSIVNTDLWGPGKWEGGSFTKIIFSPYDPNLVLAAAGSTDCFKKPETCEQQPGHGILRSMDRGETWSQTSLSDAQVSDLYIVSESEIYAAVFPDTVYHSKDAGMTWEITAQGISSQIPVTPSSDTDLVLRRILLSIAVDPFDHDRLFAGFSIGGLMISSDGGLSWAVSAAGLTPEATITDIKIDPVHPGVVYLGSFNSGVYYSTDSGATWLQLNNGLSTRTVTDLALSADGSVLYAATDGGGVFRLGGSLE